MKSLTTLLLGLLLAWTTAQATPLDFSLKGTDGKQVRLSDYRGRWVVVNFWATWCAPCVKEIAELRGFQQQYPQIQVLGINFEQKKGIELRPFMKRHPFNYPVLMLGELPLTPFEPLKGLPTTAIVDPEGRMISKHTGPVTLSMLERFFRQEKVIKE